MARVEEETMEHGPGAEIGSEGSNAAATISAIERLSQIEVIPNADGSEPLVIVAPLGKALYSAKQFFDEVRPVPERRKGTVTLLDLSSFVDYVLRWSDPGRTVIFAVRDERAPRLISIIDYHSKGHNGDPQWCQHRAVYPFPLSEEWTRWKGKSGQVMSQQDFAQFIEAGILEVLSPESAGEGAKDFAARCGVEFASPQRLVELSRSLSVRVKDTVHQAVTLSSGETQLNYTSTHEDGAGAPIKVPGAFLLGLPVFRAGESFQVCARLRYRVKEGGISWWFDLHRADRAFEVAVEDAAKSAQQSTGLALFFGTPES
jgi:hypothetical protein